MTRLRGPQPMRNQPTALSPQRLFSDPPLSGGEPVDLKFSPDGQFVAYRRAAADDRECMDLWRIELATGKHNLWVDARQLLQQDADVTDLTVQERAERERRRDFSFGITQYSWHPDGQSLFVPNGGQGLLLTPKEVEIGGGIAFDVRNITPPGTRQSGMTLSPQGQHVSYVRDGNLFVTNTLDLVEVQLTNDGSASLTNGLPDFLAAEEMHRFHGHWWAADETFLAYTKVSDATVRTSYRMEVDADGARTIAQRYPYAGEINPSVELWLVNLASRQHVKIWQNVTGIDNLQDDAYLARVTMGEGQIVVQTQDRLQQRLSLQSYDLANASWHTLYTESSDTWINLTNDLLLIDNERQLFTSEQGGTRQAFLLESVLGLTKSQEIDSPTHISAILAHHEDIVYVSGWHKCPFESHLYELSLLGKPHQQLTQEPGTHDAVIHAKTGVFLDRFSSEHTPVSLRMCNLVGEAPATVLFAETIDTHHPYYPYKKLHVYPEFGEVDAEDGQRLCYRLTPPAQIDNKNTYPTIVYVYGGPGPQKSRREWTPLTVQLFAQNGFAVLELDNRGTGNRGRNFEAPIYRNLGENEVLDQVVGLSVLKQHDWADLGRVGLFGHSYGGYMTLMGLCKAGEHFKAGVAVAPVSDWRLYDTHYTERYMGLPDDNAAGYKAANVLTHLHKLDAPLLLMHGMADDNVLFTNSTLIMAELQRLNKPFELMTYPGAKHSMQERDVSIHRFEMILDFFRRHLGVAEEIVTREISC